MHILVDRFIDLLVNVADRSHCVESGQDVTGFVVVEDGRCLGVVGKHSFFESFLCVVLSLHQRFAGYVVFTLNLWWIKLSVVTTTTGCVDTAAFDPLDQDIVINLELKNLINLHLSGLEHLVEFLCLHICARETVEQNSSFTFWVVKTFVNQANDKLVRNKLTGLHN